ncbi:MULTISPECIES: hypothetical protein [Aequorivita]|uniref:Peptidylprolyl isomerase n=1 Tax=Aequorivita iocasae TaxID=2803865 RepID=A0ABX7DT91_9FLAO|nr:MULTISPECIES: hypothetical protein [Aequorivita]QQX77223.1 hypothetical protein JK629_02830 [Aequorivita iocasae]UCA56710.1 hypothetical protein LDL78_02845 [Aequorivita sp. F7]
MRNLLTVFAFAATMLFGIQNASAQELSQDNTRPEVIAKTETAKLTETLDLTGDQSRTIFRALVAKEVAYRKNNLTTDTNSNSAEKKQIDNQLKDAMKKTLTAEQYAKWLKINN